MRYLLVGTAGHVDHGKTTLVHALTGIDCDRLAEEKRRGLTLDLGFAHLPSTDAPLGFVDVPGHERFLHNALAGLGGVDVVLLVVAADEGVRPQTREHLAIAELLAIPRLVVALTRVDLADADSVLLAELETGELLERSRFAGSPIVRVSSHTRLGLETLVDELRREVLDRGGSRRDGEPFRLPIDRAFHLRGQGVIITGTVHAGAVAPGAELELLPARSLVRVRSVEVHGERRPAQSGERTALQLAGVDLTALERGQQLVEPGAYRATRRLVVDWQSVGGAPISIAGTTEIRLHLQTAEIVATARPLEQRPIEPGGQGAVELVLRHPVVAARGDRFVARRPSPEALLGGGMVLDPFGRRHRGDLWSAARLARLRASDDEALIVWSEESGARGIAASECAPRLGRAAAAANERLAALAGAGRLVALASAARDGTSRYLAPEALARILVNARERLRRYFAEHPLASGWAKQEAIQALLPAPARTRSELFLDFLVRVGEIELAEGEVRLPGRSTATPAELSPLARAIVERFERAGLTPASAAELTSDLAPKREIVDGLVKHLVARGELTRLSTGLVLASRALVELAADVRASGWERFTVPQFKERFTLSRKWAIPLLEHLDDVRVTERVGDERRVIRGRTS